MTIICAYKKASQSARALAGELGVNVHGKKISSETINAHDTIINWGCDTLPNAQGNILNGTRFIRLVNHKGNYYDAVRRCYSPWSPTAMLQDDEEGVRAGVASITNTIHEEDARRWWELGIPLIARSLMRGSGGRGMVYADPNLGHGFPTHIDDQRVQTWLPYLKKTSEWRIHVGRDMYGDTTTIHTQQKRKRAS